MTSIATPNRATIITVSTIAAICGLAFIARRQQKPQSSLHRSNAMRRRRRSSNLSIDTTQHAEHDSELEDPAVHEVKALLYHIAEDQSRRKAFAHRGIRCEDCGQTPIRSIRWHCLNCPDFDLCSSCKALTSHPINHVFAEIRIPVPVLAQPVEKLPVWYTGKPELIESELPAHKRRKLAQHFSFDDDEIDALATQFACLVDTRITHDPCELYAAISASSFTRSLSSPSWRPRTRGNLLFERIFSFYDANRLGAIDFESFVSSIAYLRGDKRFQPMDRAIRGFDIDEDGYVSREDILRVLRAKFETSYHIMHEMANGELTEQLSTMRTNVSSSQPVSSAFRGEFDHRDTPRPNHKPRDAEGHPIFSDGAQKAVAALFEYDDEWPKEDLDQAQLSASEQAVLGLTNLEDELDSTYDNNLLNHVVSAALNRMLGPIFDERERMHALVVQTETERSKWRRQMAACIGEKDEALLLLRRGDPGADSAHPDNSSDQTKPSIAQDGVVPTDAASLERMEAALRDQSLAELLHSSGYATHDHSLRSEAVPLLSNDLAGEDSRIETMTDSRDQSGHSLQPDDAGMCEDDKGASHILYNISNALDNAQPTPDESPPVSTKEADTSTNSSAVKTATQAHKSVQHGLDYQSLLDGNRHNDLDEQPSKNRLQELAIIETAAQSLQVRGGQVCIRVEELAAMVEDGQNKELAGLLRSWLEWASF